jgi:hypothetical protein
MASSAAPPPNQMSSAERRPAKPRCTCWLILPRELAFMLLLPSRRVCILWREQISFYTAYNPSVCVYVFGCVCVVYVSVSVCLCLLEVYTKVKTLTSRHADHGNLGTSPPTAYHAYDSVFRGIECMYVCHVSFFFV